MRLFLLFLLAFVLVAPAALWAQSNHWMRTYYETGKRQQGNSVQSTPDGGFILCGSEEQQPGSGTFWISLIKTDANGVVQWKQRYGDNFLDAMGFSVVYTPADSGYLVAGTAADSFGPGLLDYHYFLVKTDAQGDTLWTRYHNAEDYSQTPRYGLAQGLSIATDGTYLVTGFQKSMNLDTLIATLSCFDTTGNRLWHQRYTGVVFCGEPIYSSRPQATPDGGYVFTSNCGEYYWITKTNPQGDTIWQRYGSVFIPWTGMGVDILVKSDGNYWVTTPCSDPVHGDMEIGLEEYSPNGDLLAFRRYDILDETGGFHFPVGIIAMPDKRGQTKCIILPIYNFARNAHQIGVSGFFIKMQLTNEMYNFDNSMIM